VQPLTVFTDSYCQRHTTAARIRASLLVDVGGPASLAQALGWSFGFLIKVKVGYLLQRLLHESDSRQKALYNIGSGSWLAWATDTAAYYAAIHCPPRRTIGPAVCS